MFFNLKTVFFFIPNLILERERRKKNIRREFSFIGKLKRKFHKNSKKEMNRAT